MGIDAAAPPRQSCYGLICLITRAQAVCFGLRRFIRHMLTISIDINFRFLRQKIWLIAIKKLQDPVQ
jgi:hypothetical protein